MYEKAKYRKKQLAFKQAVFYFAPQLELSGWPKIIKIGFKEGCKIVLLYIISQPKIIMNLMVYEIYGVTINCYMSLKMIFDVK